MKVEPEQCDELEAFRGPFAKLAVQAPRMASFAQWLHLILRAQSVQNMPCPYRFVPEVARINLLFFCTLCIYLKLYSPAPGTIYLPRK